MHCFPSKILHSLSGNTSKMVFLPVVVTSFAKSRSRSPVQQIYTSLITDLNLIVVDAASDVLLQWLFQSTELIGHHVWSGHKVLWCMHNVKHNYLFPRSVGRESHWYCGGHGFESRWSPDFFRLLLSNCLKKLENLLRWSFFTFIYHCSLYILHTISLLMGDMNSTNWPYS